MPLTENLFRWEFLAILLFCIAGMGYIIFLLTKSKRKPAIDARQLLFARTFNRLLDGEKDGLLEDLLNTYKELEHDVSIGLALGALYRHMGKLQMALKTHRSILARIDLSIELRARIQTEIAKDFLASGLLERARTAIEEPLRGSFFNEEMRQTAVRIFLALREWDKAAQMAGKKMDRSSSKRASSLIRTEQAEWLHGNQREQDALSIAKKALSLDSGNISAILTMAKCYVSLEKIEHARKLILSNIALFNHQSWRAFSALKTIAIKMNDHSWFIVELQRHFEKEPEDWRSKAVLASFLFQLGEAKKAGDLYLECLKMAPDALSLHQKIWRFLLQKPLNIEVMEQYAALMKDVLPIRNPYYCNSCGITSSQYQWQCPGCHQFGSYKERTL